MNIPGNITREERDRIYSLAAYEHNGIDVNNIVEIGVLLGATTGCLLAGSEHLESQVYSIDNWGAMALQRFWDALDAYGVERDRVTLINKDSGLLETVADVPDEIKLLVIDGNHSTRAAHKDLTLYSCKLVHSGILVVHDAVMPDEHEIPDRIFRLHRLPVLVEQISAAIEQWLTETPFHWHERRATHTMRVFERGFHK
jgi:predicted O-methyltransferase YrrM